MEQEPYIGNKMTHVDLKEMKNRTPQGREWSDQHRVHGICVKQQKRKKDAIFLCNAINAFHCNNLTTKQTHDT